MAFTAKFWSGVGVTMQSALGTAQNITGITKANPGVATYSGADTVVAGDYVILTANGMSQVNGLIVRVANVVTGSNTFELEGFDTSTYDTFTSGSFQEITFGTTLDTLRNPSSTSPSFEYADLTTMHDTERVEAPTISTAGEFSFESIYDPSNAGVIALNAAFVAKTTRAFKFVFSDGSIYAFNGYVGAPIQPSGENLGVVTFPVTIKQYKRGTSYAS